jgi:hypothetical protein
MNKEISCEESLMLASRNLDSDLARQEVADLFAHLADCGECQAAAAEMAFLESATQEVSQLYAAISLDPRFAADLQKILPPKSFSFQLPGLFQGLKGALATRAFAAFAGAVVSLALFFLLFLPVYGPVDAPARFTVHPIAFHTATDRLVWHHRKEILPGETVRLVVHMGREEAYHVKLESTDGPSKIEIVHEAAEDGGTVHLLEFHGAQYASLASPSPGDVLVARNTGRTTVIFNAHTLESGNATVAQNSIRQFNGDFSELLAVNRY